MSSRAKKIFIMVDLVLLLILVAFVTNLVLHQKNDILTEPEYAAGNDLEDEDIPVVYLDGRPYQAKGELTTILLMGIDSKGEMKSNGSFENDAKCDFAALLLLDERENTYTLIHLNRDTMTEVPHLGIGGGVAGSSTMQLALAYTYGDGMENSCENTVAAVENLLYGVEVEHYFAINMSGLEQLINGLGGVEVTVHGDFSAITPDLIDGEQTYMDGALCMTYLRARRHVGEETNIERAQRQRSFIAELLPQVQDTENLSLLMVETADHVVTDMNASQLSETADRVLEANFAELCTPEGEVYDGNEFIEFYPDDAALRELVIRLFYEPAEVLA